MERLRWEFYRSKIPIFIQKTENILYLFQDKEKLVNTRSVIPDSPGIYSAVNLLRASVC